MDLENSINEISFSEKPGSKRPLMRSPVAIASVLDNIKVVQLYATAEAIEDISGFGRIDRHSEEYYSLWVDARYDFDEVVEYIKNW